MKAPEILRQGSGGHWVELHGQLVPETRKMQAQ
jgi:hypothetical protein